MKLTLSSPGVLQVVIMITCGAHSDDKVGIVTTVDLRYYTHGPVNIRITTVIHCHLPRFLESECLSYNPVLNTPARWQANFITFDQSLWTMDQFFVTCMNCVCTLNTLYFEPPRASSLLGVRLVKARRKNLVPLLSGVKPHPCLWSGQYTEPTTVKCPPRLVQIAVYSKINAV